MDLEEADGGRTIRGPQYTKNDTDFYVSAAAEDPLAAEDDSRNPFKQDPTQQPILDPDEAALAALNGTYTSSNVGPKVASTAAPEATLGEGVKTTPAKSQADNANENVEDNHGEGLSIERRRSSTKRSRADSSLDADEADEPSETEEDAESSQGVAKKARRHRDSDNALVIQPDDTVEEEDRKMRANLQLVGTDIDREDDRDQDKDQQDNGDRANISRSTADAEETVDDDYNLSTSEDQQKRRQPTKSDNEVKPVPLMDQLTLPKTAEKVVSADNREIPRDVGDDDDDIEAKRDDDYDVENYAEYEDDQDDVGQEMEEDGPDMDERLMVDEELFGPPIVGEDGQDVMGLEHGAEAEVAT
ncbi:hypothetical protein V8F20_012641 [Naviculisporaceae sp. PSN 640]